MFTRNTKFCPCDLFNFRIIFGFISAFCVGRYTHLNIEGKRRNVEDKEMGKVDNLENRKRRRTTFFSSLELSFIPWYAKKYAKKGAKKKVQSMTVTTQEIK